MEDLAAVDPLLRPESGRGVLSWTPGMVVLEQGLPGCTLVGLVLTGRKEISPAKVVHELVHSCGLSHDNIHGSGGTES